MQLTEWALSSRGHLRILKILRIRFRWSILSIASILRSPKRIDFIGRAGPPPWTFLLWFQPLANISVCFKQSQRCVQFLDALEPSLHGLVQIALGKGIMAIVLDPPQHAFTVFSNGICSHFGISSLRVRDQIQANDDGIL